MNVNRSIPYEEDLCMQSVKVFICHYGYDKERNTYQWLLTTDRNYASAIDQNYTLASIDDLHDWVCAAGEVFNGIITTIDGDCKWCEREWVNEYGEWEYECGYELI